MSIDFSAGYEHCILGKSLVVHANSFEWMAKIPEAAIHAVVTDPPYGVK